MVISKQSFILTWNFNNFEFSVINGLMNPSGYYCGNSQSSAVAIELFMMAMWSLT